MKDQWDDKTITNFLSLLREHPWIWSKKHKTNSDSKKRYNSLQVICSRINKNHPTKLISPPQVHMKCLEIKSMYSEEMEKAKADPSYKRKEWVSLFNRMLKEKKDESVNATSEVDVSRDESQGGEGGEDGDELPPTQPNESECSKRYYLNSTPVSLSDGFSSISSLRDSKSFLDTSSERQDLVEDSQSNAKDSHPREDYEDGTLVSFGNYLVPMMRKLPPKTSYRLQNKLISLTMSEIKHAQEHSQSLIIRKINKKHSLQDRCSVSPEDPNVMDIPQVVTFRDYIVSLLRHLPTDKTFDLQQKLFRETMKTAIRYEEEPTTLRSDCSLARKRLRPSTPLATSTQSLNIGRTPNKKVPDRNTMFGGDTLTSRKRSWSTPEITIDIEDDSPLSQVKEESDDSF